MKFVKLNSFLIEAALGDEIPKYMQKPVKQVWGKTSLEAELIEKTDLIPDLKVPVSEKDKRRILHRALEINTSKMMQSLEGFQEEVKRSDKFEAWFKESLIDKTLELNLEDLWISDLLTLTGNVFYNISAKMTLEKGELFLSKNQQVNFNKWIDSFNRASGEPPITNFLPEAVSAAKSIVVDSDIDLKLLDPSAKVYLYISGKPDDILRMALFKMTESCQNLYSGGYRRQLLSNVFDPSSKVAYLVYDSPFIDDEGNEHPFTAITRSLIRLISLGEEDLIYVDKSYPERMGEILVDLVKEHLPTQLPIRSFRDSETLRPSVYPMDPEAMVRKLPPPYMDTLDISPKYSSLASMSEKKFMDWYPKVRRSHGSDVEIKDALVGFLSGGKRKVSKAFIKWAFSKDSSSIGLFAASLSSKKLFDIANTRPTELSMSIPREYLTPELATALIQKSKGKALLSLNVQTAAPRELVLPILLKKFLTIDKHGESLSSERIAPEILSDPVFIEKALSDLAKKVSSESEEGLVSIKIIDLVSNIGAEALQNEDLKASVKNVIQLASDSLLKSSIHGGGISSQISHYIRTSSENLLKILVSLFGNDVPTFFPLLFFMKAFNSADSASHIVQEVEKLRPLLKATSDKLGKGPFSELFFRARPGYGWYPGDYELFSNVDMFYAINSILDLLSPDVVIKYYTKKVKGFTDDDFIDFDEDNPVLATIRNGVPFSEPLRAIFLKFFSDVTKDPEFLRIMMDNLANASKQSEIDRLMINLPEIAVNRLRNQFLQFTNWYQDSGVSREQALIAPFRVLGLSKVDKSKSKLAATLLHKILKFVFDDFDFFAEFVDADGGEATSPIIGGWLSSLIPNWLTIAKQLNRLLFTSDYEEYDEAFDEEVAYRKARRLLKSEVLDKLSVMAKGEATT